MKIINLFFVVLIGWLGCLTVSANHKAQLVKQTPGTEAIVYTVVNGDCLYNIARQHGLSVKQLYDLNKKQIKNPNLIYRGQQFIVGYQTVAKVQTAAVDIKTLLSGAEFFGQFVPEPDVQPSLEKLAVILEQIMEQEAEQSRIQAPNTLNRELSLLDKIKQAGIKHNAPNRRPYSVKAIVRSIRSRVIYNDDKSWELDETGTKLYLKSSDYQQLLLICYGLDKELYACQDPELIIVAEELGIKYNTPRQHLYTRQEIVESMYDSLGRKKVVYSRSRRFQSSHGKIYLDCSAFAYFLGNCYGAKAPNKTTATIFTVKNGRRLVKSIDELKPGDLVGRPKDHVVTYLGHGLFAHSSGRLPLFISQEKVVRKGRLYYCSPLPNEDLTQRTTRTNQEFATLAFPDYTYDQEQILHNQEWQKIAFHTQP